MEIATIIGWSTIVVCSMFSFFERSSAQKNLFLDATLNNHMEEEFYQEIITDINYSSNISDEENAVWGRHAQS